MANLYETLGITKNASQDDIRKAYRKLAMKFHPDKASEKDKKTHEEKFKEVNEAYGVIGDPEKRKQYDTYGTYDNNAVNNASMHDVFSDMFGGDFFSMSGQGQSGFKMFFGGGGPQPQSHQQDVIEVEVTLTDIYKGVTKKVSYEVLDKCDTCMGTGAKSPSDVVKCMTCNGQGSIPQQMGPFLIQQGCGSCAGRGQVIKQGRQCLMCKGERMLYYSKSFDLRIPQGVPHKHIHRMEGKGSFDPHTNKYNDMVLIFIHRIEEEYKVDYEKNDVHITLDIPLEDLLCGFVNQIQIYDEVLTIYSKSYFNPTEPFVIERKGLPVFKKKEHGNLMIHFKIMYPLQDEKFTKYHNIFLTMFKKKQPKLPSNAIDISQSNAN
jgi:DnaJ-class molecular chaperone